MESIDGRDNRSDLQRLLEERERLLNKAGSPHAKVDGELTRSGANGQERAGREEAPRKPADKPRRPREEVALFTNIIRSQNEAQDSFRRLELVLNIYVSLTIFGFLIVAGIVVAEGLDPLVMVVTTASLLSTLVLYFAGVSLSNYISLKSMATKLEVLRLQSAD
jgi:hypothetical protein